jgi:hypothetical protein
MLMRRFIAALALVCLAPGLADAQLKITDMRPSYGPNGAARKDATKFLPGDILWIDYAIDGLKVEPKTGKVKYEINIEFFDGNGKKLQGRANTNEGILELGGNRMPGDLHLNIGTEVAPGKYKVTLTVKDILGGNMTAIDYPIEVLPKGFGIVQVGAPAVRFPTDPYIAQFGIAGFTLNKNGNPDVEVAIKVLDSGMKPVAAEVKVSFPESLPAGTVAKQLQFLPVSFPIFVNRPGQFYIDITATDKNASGKSVQLQLPLTVLNVGAVAK